MKNPTRPGSSEEASDPLAGLNPMQVKAVQHGEGPLLLLAGAGSGKTRVVTRRIARLLAEGQPPESILALTFTNRAAREMRERVAELLGLAEAPPLQISTFHALGARFLRRHAEWFGRSRSFSIYDDGDQLDMIRQAAVRQSVELKVADAKVLRRFFDRAKNAGESAAAVELPIEWARKLDGSRFGHDYDDLLERADAFDFGDLIVRPAELLAHEPAIAQRYRRQWRWILVDEFQDTNAAQYRWLKLLAPPEAAAPGPNLFVVGDDDQSIYGWRGAEVENILRFPDEYPGATVVRLEQNYRSHKHILSAANEVIAKNSRRLGKTLWTELPEGMKLELHEAAEGRREGLWIAGRIAELCRDEGLAPGEIAVLMRANHLTLDVEEGLRLLAIPHTVVRGRSFYDRGEVLDALAYVRLLVNPHDEVALRRAVNTPARGVGDKSLVRLAAVAEARDCSLWEAVQPALAAGELRGKAASGLAAFVAVIAQHREQLDEAGQPVDLRGPADRVKAALEAAGLLTELRVAAEAGEQDRDRHENVQRLLLALASFEAEAETPTLAAWLEQVKLISEIDVADPRLGAVSLMTVHAAKGLEFPVVFLMGLEEGLFPHHRSIDDEAIEEERRLCYVAITRARHRLVLTWSRERRTFADVQRNRPSRFLRELPAEALEAQFAPDPPPMRRRPAPNARGGFDRRAARMRDEAMYADPGPGDDMGASDEPGSGGFGGGWRRGMKVLHAQLGVGVVDQVKPGGMHPRLVIDFPDIGRRTITTDWVSPYEG